MPECLGIAAFCLIVVFGVLMMATAGASERPWEAGAPYRAKEAQVHSVLAGAAGVAYTVGAGTVAFTDAGAPVWLRALSLVVAVSGVVLPLAMARRPQVQGLIQRVMFALAYAWLIAEALHGEAESRCQARCQRWKGFARVVNGARPVEGRGMVRVLTSRGCRWVCWRRGRCWTWAT